MVMGSNQIKLKILGCSTLNNIQFHSCYNTQCNTLVGYNANWQKTLSDLVAM